MTAIDFPALIGSVAQRLCGDVNEDESDRARGVLRFGQRGSLKVEIGKGTYYDHETKVGGGCLDLIASKRGGTHAEAIEWLSAEGLIDREPGNGANASRKRKPRGRIVATYDYTDEAGALLYQVCRFDPKDFRQRCPDGNGGWLWKLGTTRKVLYRLPALLEAVAASRTIFVTEGEKDADNLCALGFAATTVPGGANKWNDSFIEFFRGADLVLMPDNDPAGRKHILKIASPLHGVASRIRVLDVAVHWAECPHKGDISDWITAGGTRERLDELLEQAPEWQPERSESPDHDTEPNLDTAAHDAGAEPDRYSEDALATRFTKLHAAELRYVADWGRWLRWNGCRWQTEETLFAFDAARAVCRTAAQEVRPKSKSLAAKIASARTRAAIENLARADRSHAATIDQWDADQWLLGTPNGTVDLRSGEMRPPRQEDYITKSTSIAPDADCPRWRAFLDRITDSDMELQAYLQRVAGYALTGSTREHAMFFLYGTGANGKSVFVNTLAAILGDYAKTAPIDMLMVATNDRHPTDMAGLRGARLAVATETEEGRRWAEAKVKMLTGGDPISARFMRQDFFEFTPQFKLLIAGNHKPGLRSVDEAIRRRLHLIPFTITIPPQERDLDLPKKLGLERAAILKWAIVGCLDWQRTGLAPPAAVKAATEGYLADEDAISTWLEDRCETRRDYAHATTALYGSWLDWCEKAGERPGNQKSFVQALEGRHFERARIGSNKTRGFRGLRLRTISSEDYTPSWRNNEGAA